MPLIDMVFLLLIFFLVATSFNKEERDQNVQLPRTSKAVQPASAPPRQLIVNILHDGSMKVEGKTIEFKTLQNEFVTLATKDPSRKVLIRCDDRTRFKYFAGVVDTASACGVNRVNISYLASKPKTTPTE